jgi:hypothetical protein
MTCPVQVVEVYEVSTRHYDGSCARAAARVTADVPSVGSYINVRSEITEK